MNRSLNHLQVGTAILKLLPLSISEQEHAGIAMQRDEYLSEVFLPRIYDQRQEPFRAYGNYLETYVERDLRQQINVKISVSSKPLSNSGGNNQH